MNSLDLSRWLWDFYLLASGLLLATGVASYLIAQPARRMAMAWATAGGLVLLLMLTAVPNWSRYSLVPPTPPEPVRNVEIEPVLHTAIEGAPQTVAAPVESQTKIIPATQIVTIDWGRLATLVLSTGTVIVAVWLLVGVWQVRRLRARAHAVPQNVADLLAEFPSQPSVQLGTHTELPVPVALGLRRPMILLPQTLLSRANPTELRSVLAHELAHVENRDLWLLALLRLLMILLWPHPLFWLMRSRVRHDQEILADMAAAELTTRTTYAEQLVALARSAVDTRVPRLVSSVGLWEKPSQLTQRIKLLLDDKFTILQSCSRNWRLGTVAVLGALAIGLSLVTLTPAEVEEAPSNEQITDDADDDFRTMEVRITDEAGQPIEGAKLSVGIWYTKGYQGEKIPNEYFADSQGVVKLKLPRRLHMLRLWPSKPGYVPEFVNFGEGVHEEGKLIPERYDFQLAKGSRLGGLVVDSEGQPISGVKVDVRVGIIEPANWESDPKPMINTLLTEEDFNEGAVITDEDGKWYINNAPAKTGEKDLEFRLKFTHSDFAGDTRFGELQGQQKITTEALRNETAKIVLSRGTQAKGVVTDSAGKPVTNGYVVWGENSYSSDNKQFETRLDTQGTFVTSPLALGERTFTIIAPGFRPERQIVKVDPLMPELQFELKPGKRLQVKVVDGQGIPIPSAYFHAGSWSSEEPEYNRSQTSILHDRIPRNAFENGVYVWDGAPTDAVTFHISARDFATQTVSLTATDTEQVVELTPALVVFGKVTDANTGKPIETFNVTPFMVPNGIGHMSEWKYGTVTGQNGAYDIRLDEFSESKKFKLRFEAAGYQTLFSEKTFNTNDGRVEYDVAISPAETETQAENPESADAKVATDAAEKKPTAFIARELFEEYAPNTIVGICLDENDKPLSGVDIEIFEAKEGAPHQPITIASTKSGVDGKFRFENVFDVKKNFPEGLPDENFIPFGSPVYNIVARSPGRVPGIGNELAFQIANRGKVELFRMPQAHTLKGRIVDQDDQPVAKARVSTGFWGDVVGIPENVNSARTNANGEFVIADLESYDAKQVEQEHLKSQTGPTLTFAGSGQPWERFITVNHPDFARKRQKVTTVPGDIAIALAPGAVLTGQVMTQEAGEDSKVAAGSVVSLQRYLSPRETERGETQYMTIVADAQGRFRFDSLPEGTYSLNATLAGWVTNGVDKIELIAGQTRDASSIVMTRGGIVRVQLVDEQTGKPVRLQQPTKGFVLSSLRPIEPGRIYEASPQIEFSIEGIAERHLPPGNFIIVANIMDSDGQAFWQLKDIAAIRANKRFDTIYEVTEGEVLTIEMQKVGAQRQVSSQPGFVRAADSIEETIEPDQPTTPDDERLKQRNAAYEDTVFERQPAVSR